MKNELVVSGNGVNVAVRLNTIDTSVLAIDYRSTSIVEDSAVNGVIIIIDVDIVIVTSRVEINLNYATSLDWKVKPSVDLYLVRRASRSNVA